MIQQLRSDIWCAAFVRRHNDTGRFCVIARRGDAVAGQVLIEIDHLDGTASLLMPVSAAAHGEASDDRIFQSRLSRTEPQKVRDRIAREIGFDPDIWVISIDSREDDLGIQIA